MADIAAFQGLRYDIDAVGDVSRVVCPPYDVIGPSERDSLEAASPYNCVRLVLPREEPNGEPGGKYTRARGLLEAWRAAGVLRLDADPSLYVYELREPLSDGIRTERGLLAAVALDEEGGILPHERTYRDIEDDRLALMRATEANLDPIFCVYEGSPGPSPVAAAASGEPTARVHAADGVEHLLWRVSAPRSIASIAQALSGARLIIADGHHRWQTARRFREERAADGRGPWDRQLVFLADAANDGPRLRPIHRVLDSLEADDFLEKVSGVFEVEPSADPDLAAMQAEVERRATGARAFAVSDGNKGWFLTLRDPSAEADALPRDRSEAWRSLDVAVLHALVFDRLLGGVSSGFSHSLEEVAGLLQGGSATLAVMLAPTSFAAVRAVAEAGESMPQKSTSFVPKPATGMVMRPLR